MATRSKSALLPMRLERNSQGQWVWNADVAVESNVLRFAVLSSGRQRGSTLPLNVAIADRITNRLQPAATLGAGPRQVTFGPPDSNVPADYYELTDLIPGDMRHVQVASIEPRSH